MKRYVIIGGADIKRYDHIRTHLGKDDFYICCDCGLKHREALGIVPDLIVGDFDFHENPYLDEVLPGMTAEVSLENGRLLLIKVLS